MMMKSIYLLLSLATVHCFSNGPAFVTHFRTVALMATMTPAEEHLESLKDQWKQLETQLSLVKAQNDEVRA